MSLVDWLDDLCVRFIVNLPQEELSQVERICFQVEEAQWFYEDFVRPTDPKLPSLNLRQFCLLLFKHCPSLSGYSDYHHVQAFSEFLAYKTRVPVRGAILLNDALDEVVLVKGWKKGASWSFPRGKINKDERDLDCAIREVYEETGFEVRTAGLVPDEDRAPYIEQTIREQNLRLYIFRNVPQETHFEPRTRKEISKIQWYKISDLSTQKKSKNQQTDGRGDELAVNANRYYMVAPFIVQLKKWISQQRKKDAQSGPIMVNQDYIHEFIQITSPPAAPVLPTVGNQVDHMARLVAQLQRSSQEASVAKTTSAQPVSAVEDASAGLKAVLNIGQMSSAEEQGISDFAQGRPKTKPSVSHQSEASQGPMHLPMRPEDRLTNLQLFGIRNGTIPETPMDQIIRSPPLPETPRHSGPGAQDRGIRPIPSFFPPVQPGPTPTHLMAPHPNNSRPAPQNGFSSHRYAHTNQTSRSPGATMMPPLAQLYANGATSQAPAPYQQTADPLAAQASQLVTSQAPRIPPASQLPKPKFNPHASALLDLFKASNAVKSPPPVEVPSMSRELPLSMKALSPVELQTTLPSPPSFRPTMNMGSMIERKLFTPAPQSPVSPVDTSRRGSKQHDALLSLFRAPAREIPLSTAQPITLFQEGLAAPPNTAFELSAIPSPSHSRNVSENPSALIDIPSLQSQSPSMEGKLTIKKRPDTLNRPRQVSTTATVTGPLNLPQFDQIAKKSKSPRRDPATKSTQGRPSSSGGAARPSTPIRILSRPKDGLQGTPDSLSVITPHAEPTSKAPILLPQQLDPTPEVIFHREGSKVSPKLSKPFQPQILQRPQHHEPPTGISEPSEQSVDHTPRAKWSPSKSYAMPPPALPERTASKTNGSAMPPHLNPNTKPTAMSDHRTTLLSLFNSPLANPPQPTQSSTRPPSALSTRMVVYPLIDGQRHGSEDLMAPATARGSISGASKGSRSRIGSFTMGNGGMIGSGIMGDMGSRKGSMASTAGLGMGNRQMSGSTTSGGGGLTLMDKGDLLSYLDGVVKEGHR
ncbi:mRNA-decapping enzyme subunit 2 [Agyrium rufum]|nr:mRNA-decapping enzyme subunit 2 [Agyrium rufum]